MITRPHDQFTHLSIHIAGLQCSTCVCNDMLLIFPVITAELHGWRPDDSQTLRGELTTRSSALSSRAYRQRVKSAPPTRSRTINTANPPIAPERGQLVRRRSFTELLDQYPSRAEMIREIGKIFPSPQPGTVSLNKSRPSSATKTLRIQGLRVGNK